MVLLENEINNWRIKVYGDPVGNDLSIIYYKVVEEAVFSRTGDCILIVSNHNVSLGNRVLTPAEAHSLIPVYLIDEITIEPSDEQIKYISFTIPRVLKDILDEGPIENQSGLTF